LLRAIEGERGNTEAALELLRRAVALHPDNGQSPNNLGTALIKAGQIEAARESFVRALGLLPDHPKALGNLGRTLFKLNQLEEALAIFDRVLDLRPDTISARIHRSETLVRLTQLDLAWRDQALAALHASLPHRQDQQAIHYALAALGAEPTPATSPRDYVTRVFDEYAERFDAHLTGTLSYRALSCCAPGPCTCAASTCRRA
jgi:predicted TPR repeat methyltransferase